MPTGQSLRTFVNERLTAAAEEILGVFEKTIEVYEEEIDRQRRLLEIVLKPEIKLHRTVTYMQRRAISMRVSNLRNRPLNNGNLTALSQSLLGLHRRLTGESGQFPQLGPYGLLQMDLLASPFTYPPQDHRENMPLCSLMEAPAAAVVSTAGSGSLVTPGHPDRVEPAALRVDPRNQVCPMEWGGRRFDRVISPVWRSEGGELEGRCRVTDYTPEGDMILSVLCSFPGTGQERRDTEKPQRKRKAGWEESSTSSSLPPGKRGLRL
uniref:uncharacterized protein n=1 Tax=Centroberyx gerrardi TaxID=166262 RepID=UPI003AADB795